MTRNRTIGYTPARASRRLVIGGCVFIASLLTLTGGLLLGRMTADRPDEVTAGVGLSMRQGIPIADRRSIAGAATAAQNFQIAGFHVGSGTLNPDEAAAALLSTKADDRARQVLIASVSDTGARRTTYAPLSTVVLAYSPDRAEVQVWGVAATSSLTGEQPEGTEDWGRTTVTLIWEDGQWKVLSQRFETGPWPVRSDARLAESTGDFTFRSDELNQLGWSYVPEP